MRIDPNELRHHYESLSDEELLDIDRADLAQVAQQIYDQEVARRRPGESPGEEEEAEDRDFASEPGADDSAGEVDGPPPDWLEDAACTWSSYMSPSSDYLDTGAEVQAALRQAGIPNRITVKPPEPEPASARYSLYCVMVPGELGTRAYSVVERKVFNRIAEEEWRSQLQAYTDEELRALNPEDYWGALLDKAARMKQAYQEELARRQAEAGTRR